MKDALHFATCPAWASGAEVDCNCQPDPAWRIRKDPGEPFPWRVYRHTGDQVYEPLMGCSSWQRAVLLVMGLDDLRRKGMRRSSDA